MKPVSAERIKIAQDFGLENVDLAALACREAGLPFWAACTLLEKESGGRNVYGSDAGGALSGFPLPVTQDNYAVFRWLVVEKGQTSNGVGPTQITYAGTFQSGKRSGGYFVTMEKSGLDPWNPEHNMRFGFSLLAEHYQEAGSWSGAATKYNGASSYGQDFVAKATAWLQRFGQRGTVS